MLGSRSGVGGVDDPSREKPVSLGVIPKDLELVAWFFGVPAVCYCVACLCEVLFHYVERRTKKQ